MAEEVKKTDENTDDESKKGSALLEWKKRTLSDDETTEEMILKVVVVGDGSCGKTSLCQRFARDSFEKEYHQTLGLDFFSRRINLPGKTPDSPPITVLLQVWDIGGQSINSEMLPKYLSGVNCVILVYDVTNRNSFENLKDWQHTVKKYIEGSFQKETEISTVKGQRPRSIKMPIYFLVGNKVDIDNIRVVDTHQHMSFIEECNIDGDMYTSSRTGDSVFFMFRSAAAKYLNIPMTKVDQEADIVITKGEIAPEAVPMRRSRYHGGQQTAVCCIQ